VPRSAFRDHDNDAVALSDFAPRTAVTGDDANLQFELLADTRVGRYLNQGGGDRPISQSDAE